jgi:hypothetical protein
MNNDLLLKIIEAGIKHKYFHKQDYILGLFSFIAEDAYEDDMFIIKDKTLSLKIADEVTVLSKNYTDTLLDFKIKVNLPKGYIANSDKNIETTIGRVVMNYLILAKNFSNKVPYINEPFTIGDIEDKYIATMLIDNEYKGDDVLSKITIKEYIDFMDSVTFIEGFSKLLSVAGTEKSLLPPKGIDEYKKKVVKELESKYGKDGMKDPKVISELEAKLKAFDDEWLKGDVSNGRLLYKKTKLARKKMYLNIGASNTFSGKEDGVTNSLQEGWGTDPEQLATLFNDARAGSYFRGIETANGGVAAKHLLRASADKSIVNTDCNVTIGDESIVTDQHLGRYVISNGKPVLLDSNNISKFKGKVHMLRSPMTCKLKKDFCVKCVGENMKDYEKGVSLMAIEVGGAILAMSLAKFHATGLELTEVNIEDIF